MDSHQSKSLSSCHVSIRVPWHDRKWDGTVCQEPKSNMYCLALTRISGERNDALESETAAQDWNNLSRKQLPACVAERARFMSEDEFVTFKSHPYKYVSKLHRHFKETPFLSPGYSAECIPFRWMLKEDAKLIDESLSLNIDWELEKDVDLRMGFQTEWMQAKKNQQIMLDTFFSAIQPYESLCFFYAKQTPLSDDPRKVLIGIGRVSSIGNLIEYEYETSGPHQACIWERNVQHSIRNNFSDGFLFPYHEILEVAKEDPAINPQDYVVYAPEDYHLQFSYVSEHVHHDAAITCLLQCVKGLRKIQVLIPGKWDNQIKWIDGELNRIWNMRGPYPGLGPVLKAAGFQQGNLIAHEIAKTQLESHGIWKEDPWDILDGLLKNPSSYRSTYEMDETICDKISGLSAERKAYIKLLSRFNLTDDQARRYYDDQRRKSGGIYVSDLEILGNPYLLYEKDLLTPDPLSIWIVDHGLFPDKSIQENHPIPAPSKPTGPSDVKRVRALMVYLLEKAAREGHTLQAQNQLLDGIQTMELRPHCPADSDLMALLQQSLGDSINKVEMMDKSPAYQLNRLQIIRNIIRRTVLNRIKGIPHVGNHDWSGLLEAELGPISMSDEDEQEFEEKARCEKASALETLFSSRISVLVGAAGTGKTTLLKVLCKLPEIAEGLLLLAPTGKARVRMEQQTEQKGAMTIAQFLLPIKRYDPLTGAYRKSDYPKEKGIQTLIIDECSMLTEDQLGALIDAVESPQRLILVGDQRQLPPIGSGRPFYDIINQLAPKTVETDFPKIGKGYAELTMNHRQRQAGREDILLAEWFGGQPISPGSDEIWNGVTTGYRSQFLKLENWQTHEELHERLLECVIEELGLEGSEDEWSFELKIGGNEFNGKIYFRPKNDEWEGAAKAAENWQILTPVRGEMHGVTALNRFIQRTFRKARRTLALKEKPWERPIPRPIGREGIIYGDKVINEVNRRRFGVYPKDEALEYVAIGEIGIVVGEYRTSKAEKKWNPKNLQVEFSSQKGFKYTYGGKDFSDEFDNSLSLAYALTIHKCQGSEFGTTFLIIPNPCRMLSRELLYTALTRQANRLVILYQGKFRELFKYSEPYFSETARRMTNLFVNPKMVPLQDVMFEDGLIHHTARGEAVRSKSEVIIANLLYAKGLPYSYEQPFVGIDGEKRYPDFTISDPETGLIVYWEHLGMMKDKNYRQRWVKKKEWYREQGILPYTEREGQSGILLITEDSSEGGIDSSEIKALIEDIFCV
ncbi:MAG: AAA family ATPase [Deltaproteobacteria bacterium]|nr:AAA family ATPase [Deltaproteobacteria bacterium]